MKNLLTSFLLLPAFALAHPGHGKPGWLHDHAEYIVLGALAVALAGWLIARIFRK
jgi:hypothetical protein